jgi:hypothetical protein
MKSRIFKSVLTGLLCALVAMPVLAQEDELKKLDGYIDFGDLSATYGEPSIQISIGGALLRFAGLMTENSDPDASEVMSGLEGIRVLGYQVDNDQEVAREKFAEVKSKLRSKGWEPVVQINERDEQVLVYMKIENDVMDGMTVMTVDTEEVMFINILGQIDPRKVGTVVDGFGIHLDDKVHDIDVD